MILYTYISDNKKINKHISTIENNMRKLNYSHYRIFYCGINQNIQNKHVVYFDCDDNYEGLPNKIHSLASYLVSSDLKNYYSHIYKIDGTNNPKKIIEYLPNQDYYGYILKQTNVPEYRRKYHFGRCSEQSGWNSKKYDGEFVPYCAGGYGYVLSFKSLECIANNPNDPDKDIYEDLYVSQTLLKCDIKPYHIDSRSYLSNF